MLWKTILNAIFIILQNMGSLFSWLCTPIGDDYANIALGFKILERLGLDISWLYALSPIEMISGSLVLVISTIFFIRIIKSVTISIAGN